VAFERRDDWRKARNYIEAMKTGQRRLAELPFSTRLLRETHAVLMQGVGGNTKPRESSGGARTGSVDRIPATRVSCRQIPTGSRS